MKLKALCLTLLFFIFFSCQEQKLPFTESENLDKLAESYVKLVFCLGEYDSDLVDSYFGPESLKKEAKLRKIGLDTIKLSFEYLKKALDSYKIDELNNKTIQRYRFLKNQITALISRIDILKGNKLQFNQESMLLFNVTVPVYSLEYYQKIIDTLDKLLPGKGSLLNRYESLKNKFVISLERIDTVFKTAIKETRNRTKKYVNLPEGENFEFALVKNKPWGAYNWFKGNSVSLIELNTDIPITIDRVLELACHEGYPGHHVYHSLIEYNLYKKNGWIEYSIYPLFSPIATMSEGLANFGIELLFSDKEKSGFLKNLIHNFKNISDKNLDLYLTVNDYMKKLTYAGIEAARRYLNGRLSKEQTIEWIMKYQLRSRERAEKNISFFDKYGAYVVTYVAGEELIRSYINSKAGNDLEKKWNEFNKLLIAPVIPDDLVIKK